MKLSQRQQILEHAKSHPEGFKSADLAYTGMKPNQIAHKLWELKKKKVLVHNRKKHLYYWLAAPKAKQAAPKAQAPVKPAVKPATQERDNQALKMLDNMLKEVVTTEEKYQDALAIIRYLENKLLIAIQHDARS